MMRSILARAAVVALAAAAFPSAVSGQASKQLSIQPAPPAQVRPPAAEGKDPYKGLFAPQNLESAATQLAIAQNALAAAVARKSLECTIRVIPADRQVDAKIRADLAPPDTEHTIKSLRPPC